MSRVGRIVASIGILAAMIVGMVGLSANTSAQNGELVEGIRFTAALCPSETAEFYGECVGVNGATFDVLADDSAVAGSPFTTALGLVPGDFSFDAPAGSVLTVTSTGGVPDGYVPQAGYDPLTANVDDLTIGGCGGEASCPVLEFRFVPVEDPSNGGGTEGNGDNGEIAGLPNTGVGTSTTAAKSEALVMFGMLAMVGGLAFAASRRASMV